MPQKYVIFNNRQQVIVLNYCEKFLRESDEDFLFLDNEQERQAFVNVFLNAGDEAKTSFVVAKEQNATQLFSSLFSHLKFETAAGGVVKNHKGEYLFIFRRGKWDFPKGHCEPNETIEETALRETMEETGLQGVQIMRRLPTTYHVFTKKEQWILKETQWFEMFVEGEQQHLIPQVEEDIEKVCWLSKRSMDEVKENTYRNLSPLFSEIESSWR